jgi:lactoylglutathione lyase
MTEPTKAHALGINHVVLEVDDLDAALAFYGKLFDLKLRGRRNASAFIDMGDQFLQIREGRSQAPDVARHFGLVVDDRAPVRKALEDLGIALLDRGLNFTDPWGNRVEIVPYDDIQFTKAPHVLKGMGLDGLRKTESAVKELAKKGMAPE